ncbi:pyridoxamine 5'-phosphate oxidase family protein [Micromonospora sp. WMMC241]|uniref:pyridoxamine 5'-phosphate oxidase family protein n=1 Tax=Micromonospora sp. WMMC241 TaxID=3015159 RepID=UPI0022B61BCF|nr:pyridoxamine 5'-phosphate oxidase family protein [Micromonospora sp. WMMC241]MCZ7437503.1 pyridoxamine 5'-phosphate oxidase family protein [Micromonospora sp. WMMC241]
MTDTPRTRARRRHDTTHRLEHDIDCWVASADTDGTPHLVPLSFHWDGHTLLLATDADSPTGRNLAGGRARIALGHTRDVVMIDGHVETLDLDALPTERGERFATRTGFDPRTLTPYRWYRIQPHRVQAWREVDEMPGRTLMRHGRWLD